MYAMKTIKRILLAGLAGILATSCTSAYYSSSGSAYDDLYAVHDRTDIANRQKAEAEARQAEAEARRAEAEARQAEWEAQLAQLGVMQTSGTTYTPTTRTDSDGVIIVDEGSANNVKVNVYDSFVADNYESAYARRLLGFKSATYRMPSSYFSLRYSGDYFYATAYDPAFYNVMVSGDQVWVEPKYITSMFGTWGATNATMVLHSPWYYGWSSLYDPWYYSSWGFPHYSWYDWNWNICYGPRFGVGVNLWWGWGGLYRPWRPHYHSYHPHHIGGPIYGGHHLEGGGGYYRHGGSYYGSRGQKPGTPSQRGGRALVNRGSRYSTPYRSPNSGQVYGEGSRGNGTNLNRPSQQPTTPRQGIGRNNNTRQRNNSSPTRPSYEQNRTQNRTQNYNQGSTNRGSSFGSGSMGGSMGGSRGGGFSSGGGSRSTGSRGR